jgi:hypothetical protein
MYMLFQCLSRVFVPGLMKRSPGETTNTNVLIVSHPSLLVAMYNLFNIYLNSYVKCMPRLKQVLCLKDLLNLNLSLICNAERLLS